jgi:hypothetical protein
VWETALRWLSKVFLAVWLMVRGVVVVMILSEVVVLVMAMGVHLLLLARIEAIFITMVFSKLSLPIAIHDGAQIETRNTPQNNLLTGERKRRLMEEQVKLRKPMPSQQDLAEEGLGEVHQLQCRAPSSIIFI